MRLVVVDPSSVVRRAIAGLAQHDCHDVITFADGLEALSFIMRETDVRALITSTELLSISGIQLCASARELTGSRRALHIILMSASDDYALAVSA